jgi:hypothetical protein
VASDDKWEGFYLYRSLKEHGLRREALQRLKEFIDDLSACTYLERKEFVCWLMSKASEVKSPVKEVQFLTHPLKVRIVEPLLREWIAREPNDATPHLWLGDIPDLWEAYRCDPNSPEVRLRLIRGVLKGIDYEMHELPYGFLGKDADDTLTCLIRLGRLLSGVPNSPVAHNYQLEIEGRTEVLTNFVEYLRNAHRDLTETFADWCARTGRRGSW